MAKTRIEAVENRRDSADFIVDTLTTFTPLKQLVLRHYPHLILRPIRQFHAMTGRRKTINNSDSVANLADLPEGPNIAEQRAVSRQSVPHRFTLAFVSQVPAQVQALGGFKVSSLLTAQGGRCFNVFAGLDANGDGNPLSDRPGNLGRNTLKGPRFVTLDMRVAREIRVAERVTAEFSGDFFNLLNRENVTDLNTVYGGTDLSVDPNPILGFNTPRDASNPFQFQYGMKLRF